MTWALLAAGEQNSGGAKRWGLQVRRVPFPLASRVVPSIPKADSRLEFSNSKMPNPIPAACKVAALADRESQRLFVSSESKMGDRTAIRRPLSERLVSDERFPIRRDCRTVRNRSNSTGS